MSTSTSNTSFTTSGDITSADQSLVDQPGNPCDPAVPLQLNYLLPPFALSDDGNELERLEAQRKAIDAKFAAELARRQIIMEGIEAMPKAKGNSEALATNGNALFDNSLSSKVEELSRKCAQLEKKQTEEDKPSKVEAENRLLKAELKQRETMDELKEMKTKVAKMEQQEYVCVGQFAKHLERIDEMEAQINGLKEMQKGTLSTTTQGDKNISESSSNSANENGMKIRIKMMTGEELTLIDVLPINTIEEIKAKIERIEAFRSVSRD